jgi:hypothetical protein
MSARAADIASSPSTPVEIATARSVRGALANAGWKSVAGNFGERTGLSVWWKEAGWRRLTGLSSGTRGERCRIPESPSCAIDIADR